MSMFPLLALVFSVFCYCQSATLVSDYVATQCTQNGTCDQFLLLTVNFTATTSEFFNYTYTTGTNIVVSIEKPLQTVALRLREVGTLYNKFEAFDPDDYCDLPASSYATGYCTRFDAKFCCLNSDALPFPGARPPGVYCLGSSTKYSVYLIRNIDSFTRWTISATRNGEKYNATISPLVPNLYSGPAGELQATLLNAEGSPAPINVINAWYLFVKNANIFALQQSPPPVWFVNQTLHPMLNLTDTDWLVKASEPTFCLRNSSVPATNPTNVMDQFATIRSSTVDSIDPRLIRDAASVPYPMFLNQIELQVPYDSPKVAVIGVTVKV